MLHRNGLRRRGADQHEARVGEQRRACVTDQCHLQTLFQFRQKLGDPLTLVVFVKREQPGLQTKPSEHPPGVAGVSGVKGGQGSST